MYPGSLPWAVRQLGSELDDREADGSLALTISSTTSATKVTRAVDALDDAQADLFYQLLDLDPNRSMLAREVALSAVSGDSLSYSMPARWIECLGVRDSTMDTDDEPYPALYGTDYTQYGYSVEERGTKIKWHSFTPESTHTYYARVVEEPAPLMYGAFLQAETATTTGMLGASSDYGDLPLNANGLAGCMFVIESATTGAGQERQIVSDTNSGSTTSIVVDAAWTFTSDAKWSTKLTLPRAAWRAVVIGAALRLAPYICPKREAMLQNRFKTAWGSVLQALREPLKTAYAKTRIVRAY
jgi:hypothetical protein